MLGAGGVLGAAWTIGALDAIAEVEGFDPHEADIIVGTSAGSVVAALLGAGLPVSDLLLHQRGVRPGDERWRWLSWDYDESTGGAIPPAAPRRRFARLLRRSLRGRTRCRRWRSWRR